MNFKERLNAEKRELDEKLAKLRQFRETTTFAELESEDQDLLIYQEGLMEDYSEVLAQRINRANRDE